MTGQSNRQIDRSQREQRGCRCATPYRNGGHTLVEALVALLLLAIGAMGAGALLLKSRRVVHQSSLHSSAVQLAARAGENMRANAPAMMGADGANPYLQLDYDALADGEPAAASDCSAQVCDSAALAQADLAALRRALFEHFPPGRVKICRDSAAWDAGAAQLRWACDGAAAAPVLVKIGWRGRLADAGAAATGAPVLVALPVLAARAGGGGP